jgi:hypothetical protein
MQVQGITATQPAHAQVKIEIIPQINVPCISSQSCLPRNTIHPHSAQKYPVRNKIVLTVTCLLLAFPCVCFSFENLSTTENNWLHLHAMAIEVQLKA